MTEGSLPGQQRTELVGEGGAGARFLVLGAEMWAQTEMHDYGLASLVQYWRKKQRDSVRAATLQIISPIGIPFEEAFGEPDLQKAPQLLVQAAIVVFGDKTNEGSLIEAVGLPS